MLDRRVLRMGAGSLMFGTVLAFVFNLLHPRGDDFSAGAHLQEVADSGIWLLDHFMLAWSLAFILVGLLVVSRSYPDEPAASWGRIASYAGVGGIIVGFVLIVIDGSAVKLIADDVAAGEAPAAAGEAVVHISSALFTGMQGSLFGLTPVLFGIAGLTSAAYPRWLAYLALAAGIVGFVSASIQYFTGLSTLTAVILFPIASLAFTVWGFIMGWNLWRAHGASTPVGHTPGQQAA